MEDSIYAVTGTSGAYSDTVFWVSGVFESKTVAERYKNFLNNSVTEFKERNTGTYFGQQYEAALVFEKDMRVYDSQFDFCPLYGCYFEICEVPKLTLADLKRLNSLTLK